MDLPSALDSVCRFFSFIDKRMKSPFLVIVGPVFVVGIGVSAVGHRCRNCCCPSNVGACRRSRAIEGNSPDRRNGVACRVSIDADCDVLGFDEHHDDDRENDDDGRRRNNRRADSTDRRRAEAEAQTKHTDRSPSAQVNSPDASPVARSCCKQRPCLAAARRPKSDRHSGEREARELTFRRSDSPVDCSDSHSPSFASQHIRCPLSRIFRQLCEEIIVVHRFV